MSAKACSPSLGLCIWFFLLFAAEAIASDTTNLSFSPAWLRIYQYEKTILGEYQSDIAAEAFFFAPDGRTSPAAELSAAMDAFSDINRRYGTQNQPAACVFPARKRVLERLVNRKFPEPPCPDLKSWIQRIGADQISVVFVGAYAGNPASILGHTFLRLSNSARENTAHSGMDLLSYSVGFLAHSDPRDNRLSYMVKGLTGQYPGHYEIEPHYMKVGLYNNSESRDLWEVKTNLSISETEFLIMHLWELTFNAKIPYYFIDENCSFRLLSLLEAVRPETRLTEALTTVVLPAETVRVLLQNSWVTSDYKFRSSIRRRIEQRLSRMSTLEQALFSRAKQSLQVVEQLSEPIVIDTLLDYWLYENYRAKTQLSLERRALMEATYLRASQIKGLESQTALQALNINTKAPPPPFLGHKPKSIEVGGGIRAYGTNHGGAQSGASSGTYSPNAQLSYRSGVNPAWSSDPAYAGMSSIEYLGFDLEWIETGRVPKTLEPLPTKTDQWLWHLLLVEAQSLENFFGLKKSPSWRFSSSAANHCDLCFAAAPQIHISGSVGVTHRISAAALYAFLDLRTAAWHDNGAQGLLAPGVSLGAQLHLYPASLLFEASQAWRHQASSFTLQSRATFFLNQQQSLFARSTYSHLTLASAENSPDRLSRDELAFSLGFTQFFD